MAFSAEAFLHAGGRTFDTAEMYLNYESIRDGIAKSGVPREQVWITSKVNTDKTWLLRSDYRRQYVNTTEGTIRSVKEALQALSTSYIDLMLIHGPWNTSHEERVAVWRGLIEAQKAGTVHSIGVSNFNRTQILELEDATGVLPAANEIEFHPWVPVVTREFVRWCQSRDIAVIAYNSLGGRHNRARGSAIAKIAAKYGVHNAQVLLRWAIDQGVAVIPSATSVAHIRANLAIDSCPLTRADHELIEKAERPRAFAMHNALGDKVFQWKPPIKKKSQVAPASAQTLPRSSHSGRQLGKGRDTPRTQGEGGLYRGVPDHKGRQPPLVTCLAVEKRAAQTRVEEQLQPAVTSLLPPFLMGNGVYIPRLGFRGDPAAVNRSLALGHGLIDLAGVANDETCGGCDGVASAIRQRSLAQQSKPFCLLAGQPAMLSSKVGSAAAMDRVMAHVQRGVQASGGSHLDLYLLPCPSSDAEMLTTLLHVWAGLKQLQLHGLLGSIGMTHPDPVCLERLEHSERPAAVLFSPLQPLNGPRKAAETLVRFCEDRAITVIAMPPAPAANTDALARYGLQRGFVQLIDRHVGLRDIVDYRLSEAQMQEFDCGGTEERACTRPHKPLGILGQPTCATERLAIKTRQTCPTCMSSFEGQQRLRMPQVWHQPGAEDPIGSYPRWRSLDGLDLSELLLAPRLEIPPPGFAAAPSVYSYRVRFSPFDAYPAHFKGLAQYGGASDPAFFDSRYTELIATLGHEVESRVQTLRKEPKFNTGSERTITLIEFTSAAGVASQVALFSPALKEVVFDYVSPYVQQHVYGLSTTTNATECAPRLTGFVVHRNMYGANEFARSRGSLWHWDTGPTQRVKMLLYLTPVDAASGCFVALRHNSTGRPFYVNGRKPWGGQNAPANVPKEWMLSMLQEGYRASCLTGPAGTLNVFDHNIVHRASRPRPGRHRDAVTLFFRPPVGKPKEGCPTYRNATAEQVPLRRRRRHHASRVGTSKGAAWFRKFSRNLYRREWWS